MLTLKSYQPGTKEWLEQAVTISWFTDARAPDDATLPDNSADQRGYWGDMFGDFSLGSLLWMLKRETLTDHTINQARDYARDALSWLLTTPWVSRIEIRAQRYNHQTLALVATLTLSSGEGLTVQKEWSNQ